MSDDVTQIQKHRDPLTDGLNSFIRGLTRKDSLTENLMPAHSHSGSANLDLFFNLGTRNLPAAEAARLFGLAFGEHMPTAMKILFYNRDARGGRGERASFRGLLRILSQSQPDVVRRVAHLVPEYGRWDDLHVMFGTLAADAAKAAIVTGLNEGNALAAKWTPRKGDVANRIREAMGLTPRQYRKMLVGLTKVVETMMCAKKWDAINYSHVPSRAGMIYAKAFHRHDEARYDAWREALKKPKEERQGEKINVDVLYPHEIVHRINDRSFPVQQAWEALGELFPPVEEKIICVCDVSGSMSGLPMEVSVSLGIFLSERLTGPFKDMFITFSAKPKLQRLHGSLADKVSQLETAEWTMNTNLEAVFHLITRASAGADPKDVPHTILILSDMQFDEATRSPSDSALEMIDRQYAERGVKRPNVVFWNLRAVSKTLPVQHDEKGTALVSGFSPSVLKTLVNHPGDFTPMSIMRRTLSDPRYDAIDQALRP